jgi:hypothetical protein
MKTGKYTNKNPGCPLLEQPGKRKRLWIAIVLQQTVCQCGIPGKNWC